MKLCVSKIIQLLKKKNSNYKLIPMARCVLWVCKRTPFVSHEFEKKSIVNLSETENLGRKFPAKVVLL